MVGRAAEEAEGGADYRNLLGVATPLILTAVVAM